jgi:hypothetical protein
MNTWRKSNYIEDQKIAKDIYGEKASTNEASNQRSEKPIGQTNMPIETRDIKWKKRYYDKSEQVLKKIGKLPKVYAQIRIFAFEYKVHKHGIITPTILFNTIVIPFEIEYYDKRKMVL